MYEPALSDSWAVMQALLLSLVLYMHAMSSTFPLQNQLTIVVFQPCLALQVQ